MGRFASRRQRGGALKVILLVLAGLVVLAMVAAVFAFWMVHEFVQVDVGKGVEVQTPVGGLKIEKAEDVARQLNLPLYAGAEALTPGVHVRMHVDDEHKREGFDLTAAKFATHDSFRSVDDWYRAQLGPEFVREEGRIVDRDPSGDGDEWKIPKLEPGGKDVLYKYERDETARVVALENRHGRVEISLLEVHPARAQ